jgi:uncharacterized protein
MVTNIFVNLPVKNLNQSVDFFTKLGFTFNPQFTDDSSTCMIIGPNIFAMLLSHERFRGFIKQEISDAKKTTEVLIGLALESREEVSAMVQKAVAAGGTLYNEPKDHGFMLQHGFQDLDGHIWEVFFMDPSFVQPT